MVRQRGAKARGREVADGVVVLKDSRARTSEIQSIHPYMHDQRQQLQEHGVLMTEDGQLVFTQDFRFTSPSTAAGVVLVGGAANDRKAWKDITGRPLKQLQEARAGTAP